MSAAYDLNKKQWQDFFQEHSSDWDEYYSGTDYASYAKQMRARYAIELVERYVSPGKRLLDIGCGTGWVSCILAQRGYEVIGVDFSERMIELANRNAYHMGVDSRCRFILGEIEETSLGETGFDGIIALGYLEYILKPKPVLSRIFKLLAPSGTFVAQIWNRIRLVHLLNLRDGPARIFNPFAFCPRILRKTALASGFSKTPSRSTKTDQPPLVRKWYTPCMLDRVMRDAGFLKHGYVGHLFAGFRYGNKLLLPDRVALRLEDAFVRLASKGPLRTAQLLGENYIGVYYRPVTKNVG